MPKNIADEKCLICGQNMMVEEGIFTLFRPKNAKICGQCQSSFSPTHASDILYDYNAFFRSLLFSYKGLGDLALAPIFLDPFLHQLKRKYRDYLIVTAPSSLEDNLRRGFEPLPWIFKPLNLPILTPLYKKTPYKQASSHHRQAIIQVLDIIPVPEITGKKVLLVDDVVTSGYTLAGCYALLKAYQPASIEILVLSCKKEKRAQVRAFIRENLK